MQRVRHRGRPHSIAPGQFRDRHPIPLVEHARFTHELGSEPRSAPALNVDGLRHGFEVPRIDAVLVAANAGDVVQHHTLGDRATMPLVDQPVRLYGAAIHVSKAVAVRLDRSLPKPASGRRINQVFAVRAGRGMPGKVAGAQSPVLLALHVRSAAARAERRISGMLGMRHCLTSHKGRVVRRAGSAPTLPGFRVPQFYQQLAWLRGFRSWLDKGAPAPQAALVAA